MKAKGERFGDLDVKSDSTTRLTLGKTEMTHWAGRWEAIWVTISQGSDSRPLPSPEGEGVLDRGGEQGGLKTKSSSDHELRHLVVAALMSCGLDKTPYPGVSAMDESEEVDVVYGGGPSCWCSIDGPPVSISLTWLDMTLSPVMYMAHEENIPRRNGSSAIIGLCGWFNNITIKANRKPLLLLIFQWMFCRVCFPRIASEPNETNSKQRRIRQQEMTSPVFPHGHAHTIVLHNTD